MQHNQIHFRAEFTIEVGKIEEALENYYESKEINKEHNHRLATGFRAYNDEIVYRQEPSTAVAILASKLEPLSSLRIFTKKGAIVLKEPMFCRLTSQWHQKLFRFFVHILQPPIMCKGSWKFGGKFGILGCPLGPAVNLEYSWDTIKGTVYLCASIQYKNKSVFVSFIRQLL